MRRSTRAAASLKLLRMYWIWKISTPWCLNSRPPRTFFSRSIENYVPFSQRTVPLHSFLNEDDGFNDKEEEEIKNGRVGEICIFFLLWNGLWWDVCVCVSLTLKTKKEFQQTGTGKAMEISKAFYSAWNNQRSITYMTGRFSLKNFAIWDTLQSTRLILAFSTSFSTKFHWNFNSQNLCTQSDGFFLLSKWDGGENVQIQSSRSSRSLNEIRAHRGTYIVPTL